MFSLPRTGSDGSTSDAAFPLSLPPDLFRGAIFALVVLTISRIHQEFSFIGQLSPGLVLAGTAALAWFLKPDSGNLTEKWTHWPLRTLAAFVGVVFVTAPFGISLGNSGVYFLRYFSKVLALCLLVMAAIRTARDLRLMVAGFVSGIGLLILVSLFSFQMSTVPGGGLLRLDNLHTWDANDLALILVMGLPLTLLLFETATKRGKILWGSVLIGTGIGLARSGSRGGFIGLAVVGTVLLFWSNHVSIVKRIGYVVAVVGALAVISPPGYWNQMQSLVNPTGDYNWESEYGRRAIAERGLDYMLENPLTGLGLANFERAECTISRLAENYDGYGRLKCTAPHNSFLEAGAELGIPGLILWSCLVFGGIFGVRRLRRRIPDHWARGDPEERFLYRCTKFFPLAMLGFASTSFFLTFAFLDPLYIMVAFTAGLYVAVEKKRVEQAESGASPRPIRFASMVRHMRSGPRAPKSR